LEDESDHKQVCRPFIYSDGAGETLLTIREFSLIGTELLQRESIHQVSVRTNAKVKQHGNSVADALTHQRTIACTQS